MSGKKLSIAILGALLMSTTVCSGGQVRLKSTNWIPWW